MSNFVSHGLHYCRKMVLRLADAMLSNICTVVYQFSNESQNKDDENKSHGCIIDLSK